MFIDNRLYRDGGVNGNGNDSTIADDCNDDDDDPDNDDDRDDECGMAIVTDCGLARIINGCDCDDNVVHADDVD